MSRLIAGVDEAGRGPIAGPVFAACVILGPEHGIAGLADSKQLNEKKRDYFAALIKERALAWSVASASVAEIDQLNILQATLLAMQRAIARLPVMPDSVLIDGVHAPTKIRIPVTTVIKGDALIAEIAAASILAKTARDAEMMAHHLLFPQYGFDRHKGYPTKAHLAALERYGATEIHRRSFSPVKAIGNSND